MKIQEIINNKDKYNLFPIVQETLTDFETPLSLYQKTSANILLEGVENGTQLGEYSFIAIGKKKEFSFDILKKKFTCKEYSEENKITTEKKIEKEPLPYLSNYFQKKYRPYLIEGLPSFYGGFIGYLGYETMLHFEDIQNIVNLKSNAIDIPDGIFTIPQITISYNNITRKSIITTMLEIEEEDNEKKIVQKYKNCHELIKKITIKIDKPINYLSSLVKKEEQNFSFYKSKKNAKNNKEDIFKHVKSNFTKKQFCDAVKKCVDYIRQGEAIQIVISQQFKTKIDVPPFEIYRMIREMNPSPYLFFLDFKDFQLIGSSPEVMVKIEKDDILLKPIAGTRPRGENTAEDKTLELELLQDKKEVAEHLMLVDLGRNDIGRVSEAGTVRVEDYMHIEKYSHVQHIVSNVYGKKKKEIGIFEVLKSVFPAGTLSGAPKIRAMQIIAEIEPFRRGAYGGCVFTLSFHGNFNSCITIRTLLTKKLSERSSAAVVQAGAGVVFDSSPKNEFLETQNKAKAILLAVLKAKCQNYQK